jgi:hypothetical protein
MSYFRSAQDKADFEQLSKMLHDHKTRGLTYDEKCTVGIIANRAPEPIRTQTLEIWHKLMDKEVQK